MRASDSKTPRPCIGRIDSVDQLLDSPWGRAACDASTVKRYLSKAEKRLGTVKNNKVAANARAAIGLLRGGLSGKDMLTPRNMMAVGAAIIYFVWPLDIIPDALPVVGWLDDLGVLSLVLGYVGRALTGGGEEPLAEEALIENIEAFTADAQMRFAPRCTLQEELSVLLKEAEELQDDALVEEGETLQDLALDPMQRVILTGKFSAGKTSLINRLLGDACLPVGITATTCKLTTVFHGSRFLVAACGKDGSLETSTDPGVLSKKNASFVRDADEVVVYHPAGILENGFCLVDTPGLFDSANPSKSYALDFADLPRSDAFVYVKSLSIADFSAGELEFLALAAAHMPPDRIIIVLSKADLIGDSRVLDKVERNMRLTLTRYGLSEVPFFRVRQDAGQGDMLQELKAELLKRAQDSEQLGFEHSMQEAVGSLRSSIERAKSHKRKLELLPAGELARRQQLLARRTERVQAAFARRAESLRMGMQADLHDFLFHTVYPGACEAIDNRPVNEKTVAELSSTIHTSLGRFLESRCSELVQKLGVRLDEDERVRVLAASADGHLPTPGAGAGRFAPYTGYILPAIALVTFFPMGIFGWLTHIAVPTFLMDKLGVGKGLGKLFSSLGQDAAREKLKQATHEALCKLEDDVAAGLSEMISRGAARAAVSCAKGIELSED